VNLGGGSLGWASSVLLSSHPPSRCSPLTQKLNFGHTSRNFVEQVATLKQRALPKGSGQYRPPSSLELTQFNKLADALFAGNCERALALANQLDYRLLRLKGGDGRQTLIGAIEQPNRDGAMRGWGSYFTNTSPQTDTLVEAPHVLFDRFTPELAARAFAGSGAHGFLMAGAHRHANGSGTADVCDPIASIFQEVHQAWSVGDATAWQIHGFDDPETKGLPANTQIVLSNGAGEITTPILALERLLEERGYTSYAYNTLPAEAFLNQKLNGEVAGKTFSPLAATENVQGQYSRRVGASFVHVEIAPCLRMNEQERERVANAIGASIRSAAY